MPEQQLPVTDHKEEDYVAAAAAAFDESDTEPAPSVSGTETGGILRPEERDASGEMAADRTDPIQEIQGTEDPMNEIDRMQTEEVQNYASEQNMESAGSAFADDQAITDRGSGTAEGPDQPVSGPDVLAPGEGALEGAQEDAALAQPAEERTDPQIREETPGGAGVVYLQTQYPADSFPAEFLETMQDGDVAQQDVAVINYPDDISGTQGILIPQGAEFSQENAIGFTPAFALNDQGDRLFPDGTIDNIYSGAFELNPVDENRAVGITDNVVRDDPGIRTLDIMEQNPDLDFKEASDIALGNVEHPDTGITVPEGSGLVDHPDPAAVSTDTHADLPDMGAEQNYTDFTWDDFAENQYRDDYMDQRQDDPMNMQFDNEPSFDQLFQEQHTDQPSSLTDVGQPSVDGPANGWQKEIDHMDDMDGYERVDEGV